MNPQMMIAITGKNMAKPAFDSVISDANRAAAAVDANGSRMAASMQGASFQTGNLAAQFNDIGVMLAAGQSPLMLAIQQGTQINQIFSGMKAADALNAMKTAAMSLISPLSLITVGSIAAGAALFQYLTSLNTDGRESTEVIKEQTALLRQVAQQWGDAVPALKAYVDQLDRAANLSDLNAATDFAVGQAFANAAAEVDTMRAELAAARIDLQQIGASAQEIDALQGSFDSLRQKVADGTATTSDLNAVMALLGGTTGAQTLPSMMGFMDILQSLAPVLERAASGAGALRAERDALLMMGPDPGTFYDQQDFISEQARLNSLTTEQLNLEREVARVKSEASSSDVVLSEQQALELAVQRLETDKRRADIVSSTKSSGKAFSDMERERKAVADLIEELEHEQSLIGMTNTDKAIQNALRQAGAAATDEERQRISELVTVTAEHQEAQKLLTDQWDQYGKIGMTAIRGVASALRDGKIEANELSSIMDKILDSSIDMALNGISDGIGTLFGGGGSSWLSSLFGMGGSSAKPVKLPGYAAGTNNHPGGLARVFEEGGEIINLPSGSQVIPHDLSRDIMRGSGAGTVNLTIINSGEPMEVESVTSKQNSGGGVDVKAVVKSASKENFADGSMDSMMAELYGLKRVGR